MPRHPRLRVAGLPLHVIQRGHNRSCCFPLEEDRVVYLGLLGELARAQSCDIHAYVLMTNHVHLLLTPAAPENASGLMKNLGQRYVQYINRRYGRTGSLWEGRFRSSIVDADAYLLRCSRYIELNPVRARLVRDPRDYAWSSHGSNGYGVPSALLVPHPNYVALGDTLDERLSAYRALFERAPSDGELKEIRDAANGGFALGNEAFTNRLERALGIRARRM